MTVFFTQIEKQGMKLTRFFDEAYLRATYSRFDKYLSS